MSMRTKEETRHHAVRHRRSCWRRRSAADGCDARAHHRCHRSTQSEATEATWTADCCWSNSDRSRIKQKNDRQRQTGCWTTSGRTSACWVTGWRSWMGRWRTVRMSAASCGGRTRCGWRRWTTASCRCVARAHDRPHRHLQIRGWQSEKLQQRSSQSDEEREEVKTNTCSGKAGRRGEAIREDGQLNKRGGRKEVEG